MGWFTWFGRWQERDGALQRIDHMRRSYADLGAKVIQVSRRTSLARQSAGSTAQAFAHIDDLFTAITADYAQIGEQIGGLEGQLQTGRVGDLAAVESAVRTLGPRLDELDGHLARWEALWQEAPRQLADARESLRLLRLQLDEAVAVAGMPLPVAAQVESTEGFIARIEATLISGNPIEAGGQLADLHIAVARVGEEIGRYISAARAVAEAVAAAQRRKQGNVGAPNAEEVERGLVALKESLGSGQLDRFSVQLTDLHRHLSD